jgi:type IV pilus assembly protein PilA
MNTIKLPLNIVFKKYLLQKQKNKGFTLIELLVVIIIIGVLAAVAFPSLISQVGKARETEATNNLGTMARSQNAYHFEHQKFASTLTQLSTVGSFTSKYFTFPDPTSDDTYVDNVKHQAVHSDPTNKDVVRDYALGVYFNGSAVANTICRGADIGQTVEAGANAADPCTNSGTRIE